MRLSALCLPVMIAAVAFSSGCGQSRSGSTESSSAEEAPKVTRHLGSDSNSSERPYGVPTKALGPRAFLITDFGTPPEGNAAAAVDELKAHANAGDSKAAYSLYLTLRKCMEEIESSANGRKAGSAKPHDGCENVAVEDYAKASDWLEIAAEQGSLPAQLLFADDGDAILGSPSDMVRNPEKVIAYKEQAMRYLTEASKGGSVDALLRLGNAYSVGVLVDQNFSDSNAYYEAVRAIDPSLVPTNAANYARSKLGAKELVQSTQKGRVIYESCCGK